MGYSLFDEMELRLCMPDTHHPYVISLMHIGTEPMDTISNFLYETSSNYDMLKFHRMFFHVIGIVNGIPGLHLEAVQQQAFRKTHSMDERIHAFLS